MRGVLMNQARNRDKVAAFLAGAAQSNRGSVEALAQVAMDDTQGQ